jgi:hypothetical protein
LVTVTVTTLVGSFVVFVGLVVGLAVGLTVGVGAGGGGGTVAGVGLPSTVTAPSALIRRKAGFGLGTKPREAAAAASDPGACLAARSRSSCCSVSEELAF